MSTILFLVIEVGILVIVRRAVYSYLSESLVFIARKSVKIEMMGVELKAPGKV